MSVQRRRLKGGAAAYDARVRDANGREMSRTFRTKAEAVVWEREQLTARDGGVLLPSAVRKTLFIDVANDWLKSHPGKKASTLACDASILRTKLESLHTRRIGSISRSEVQSLVTVWSASHAPKSVSRYLAVMRAIFNFAVESDLLGRSPCRKLNVPRLDPISRPGRLTAEQIMTVCASVEPRYRALILLIAETAMRPQEAIALRVGSLDLDGERPQLRVVDTIGEVRGRRTDGAPKSTAGIRPLAISAPLAAELRRHLMAYGPAVAAHDELVFTTAGGSVVRYSNFRSRIWNKARVVAGADWATLYDLRRANSTAMFDLGVDVSTAQKRMGHSDPRLTLRTYAQRSSASDHAAADALGRWLAEGANDRRVDNATSRSGGMSQATNYVGPQPPAHAGTWRLARDGRDGLPISPIP